MDIYKANRGSTSLGQPG